MTWISLAANRYKLRGILDHNYSNPQNKKMRFEVIDSMPGLYALLSGDEFYIENEIETAEFLVSNYIKKTAPPYEILSDVMSLVIIADLGETDYTDVFSSIAESKSYREDFQKSLKSIARRIAGIEQFKGKIRKEKGHVLNRKSWLQLVEEYDPEQMFCLAVTLDHPDSFLLEKFILPLAFLSAQNQSKKDRNNYIREITAWGAANIREKKNIVYERTDDPPDIEAVTASRNKFIPVGFDAVELNESEVVGYYYIGENLKISRLFEREEYLQCFFENVPVDWLSVEKTVETEIKSRIRRFRDENKCRYEIVYDVENIKLPEKILDKIAGSLGLNLVMKDITEI